MKKRKTKSLAAVGWENLTFSQKEKRLRALEALGIMRKEGESLSTATKETGITPTSFKRHVGTAIRKKVRWKAKSHDRISRVMTIFNNGKRYNIETKSSATASVIGRYNSAVGHYTQTGDATNLQKLKGVVVRDSQGRSYVLETRPGKVIQILERLEEPDVPTIYAI